ncbi:DUF2157 domain-containing protein [Undibacterium fentianense]|uniref:DUF2157 domain-containing protein n=1 Tax=Undibacterium fentianense TaxID=2828728 RepID=A0A941IGD3_9BURK|nr:DUF2157 domain-containing protein [Undibacterium fentianense]MBR7801706.1 DUF2157 domain-containing protein [Undibacterium fentianense]
MERYPEILDWIAQKRIEPGREQDALRHAGLIPDRLAWRRFIDQCLLWSSVVGLAVSLIFFLAYNWQYMGRFAKLGLVEAAIVLCLLVCLHVDLRSQAGKACLLLASLLVGALLALVGQIYQTGADTYELFQAWAIACLIWVALAQMAVLYVFWLVLVNLAVALYFQATGIIWGMLFAIDDQLWMLFGLNTLAMVIWEFAAAKKVQHLQERWPARLIAVASGAYVTMLVLHAIFQPSHYSGESPHVGAGLTYLIYLIWLAAIYFAYRFRIKDLFVIAGGLLSLLVTGNLAVAKLVLDQHDAGGFLLLSLLIIGSSAISGIWLKKLTKEMQ